MNAEAAYTIFRDLIGAFPEDHHVLTYMPMPKADPIYHVKVEFTKGLPVSKMAMLTDLTVKRHDLEMAEFDTDSSGLVLHLR